MKYLLNSPMTTGSINQLKLDYNCEKELISKAILSLKEAHIRLYAFLTDIDDWTGDLIKVTLSRGFSNIVDKSETLAGYRNREIGILDAVLLKKNQIPIYKIRDYFSILPVKKSYFAIRTFICEPSGCLNLERE